MSLETTHHEIKVGYDTDTDEWVCRDMGLKAKTFSLLRKKMDKVLSVERRIDNLPILIMGDGWAYTPNKLTPGVATLFDRQRGLFVWVNFTRGNTTERKKMPVKQVWRDTPENRERLDAIVAQHQRVREEQAKLSEMAKAVEAFTITELEVASLKTVQQVTEEGGE